MGHLSFMFNGLVKSLSLKKGRNSGNCNAREAVEAMARDAKKNGLILRSSGTVNVSESNNFASLFSKRGEKGVNQDCFIVWEEFGCQEDTMFCGIFDGHGPWGHFVAKRVREVMPSSLLCNWQETLAEAASLHPDFNLEDDDKKLCRFNIWQDSYLKTCAAVDQDLSHHWKIDSFHSGTTALTIVRQGELIFVANVGDPGLYWLPLRMMAAWCQFNLLLISSPIYHGKLRIIQCKGRVFCLEDEPELHRVWLPDEESPGLTMSRAFGDYCVKDFGLISVPEVTHRRITRKDQFVVLATDGVWDVISNEEAVQIVSSTADRAKSAKHLVELAARSWKRKRQGITMDDFWQFVFSFTLLLLYFRTP